MIVFSALWTVAPPTFLSGWTLPPFPVLMSFIGIPLYSLCVWGGGYEALGLREIKTCRKVPLQVNFLDDDILQCFYEAYLLYRDHFHVILTGENQIISSHFLDFFVNNHR